MGYYECSFTVSPDQREAVIAFCSRMGCLGMTEEENAVVSYFPDTLGFDTIRSELTAFQHTLVESELPALLKWHCTYLAERDWNETWKKRFVPIEVGERLTVIPPWETAASGRLALVIDPGMAFGTGHHETTRTCLEQIEKIAGDGGKRLTFLDVGTGTGILAIAAAKLGFRYSAGVDIDPLAIDASVRNIALNDCADAITVRQGTILDVKGAFDVIAANLMSEVLIRISHDLARRLRPSGILLTSGMISGQEDDVIRAMGRAGLRPAETVRDERWVSVVFVPA